VIHEVISGRCAIDRLAHPVSITIVDNGDRGSASAADQLIFKVVAKSGSRAVERSESVTIVVVSLAARGDLILAIVAVSGVLQCADRWTQIDRPTTPVSDLVVTRNIAVARDSV